MCYSSSARPPRSNRQRGVADTRDLTLRVADGNQLSVFAARGEQPARLGVLVLGDAGGMRPFYRELVREFGEIGIDAITFDYYGRTAGPTEGRSESFEIEPHLEALTSEGVLADARAALQYLRESGRGALGATVALGFCMGGVGAIRLGVDGDVDGVVAFYPPIGFSLFGEGAAGLASRMQRPMLALFGDQDEVIPPERIALLQDALTAADVEHEVLVYPGAGHGFFEESQPQVANKAYSRLLEFLDSLAQSRADRPPQH